MRKRIISLVLTVCMVLTVMPSAVFATETVSETTTVTTAVSTTDSTTVTTAAVTTATTIAETTATTTATAAVSTTDTTEATGTTIATTATTTTSVTSEIGETTATTVPTAVPKTVTPTDVTTETDVPTSNTGSGLFNATSVENSTQKINTPKITSATDVDAIEKAQLLINSLPDAEDINESNLETVENHLDAIDEALSNLTDGERATLNFDKYNAAIAAVNALYGMEGAGEPNSAATGAFADTHWYYNDQSANSYTLTTAEQLYGFSELVNNGINFSGKTIYLGNSIDLKNIIWKPIGFMNTPFSGDFDGQGYTVSNMSVTINDSYTDGGFFGRVENGNIKNLNVSGTVSGKGNVGGIVGYIFNGSVSGCSFSGSVSGVNYCGGIAGYTNSADVINCYNTGSVSGSNGANGGIVGGIAGGVENCYNTGSVSNGGNIASSSYYSSIKNSYYLGTTSSGEQKTAAEFSSGEIAYLLQGSQSGQVWGQEIGKDNYPVLTTSSSKRVYRVTFSVEGTETYAYVNNGKTVTKPTDNPTKSGSYVFAGWYNGNTKYNFTEAVTSDITLTAKFVSSEVSSEAELRTAIEAGVTKVKLTGDITLTSDLDLSGKNSAIDLNGHVISGSKIYINTGLAKASLTITDSNPYATHSDSTLPNGGVITSTISITQNGGSYHECDFNANGGTVTSDIYSNTQAVSINCTGINPTSFTGNINGFLSLKGGIYYGNIGSSVKTGTNITVEFVFDGKTYAKEFVTSGSCVTAPIEPEKDGFDFKNWYEIDNTTGNQYEWNFGSDKATSDIVLTAICDDIEAPKVTGLEADKTYCSTPVKFKVTDNVGVASVEFGSYTLTSDSDGYYSVTEEMGWGMLVAKDAAGNTTYVTNVRINDGHTCNLKKDDTQYWYECIHCDYKSTKYDIPDFEIVIDGPDEICRGQNYVFSFKLPDDYYDVSASGYFEHISADTTSFDFDGDTVTVTIYASGYEEGASTFDVVAGITFEVDKANNFYYSISAKKKVTIVDGHIDLKHVEAKAATTESEGNIEYWYCANCGKYYSDKELTDKITKEQTVVPKKSPLTDDGTGELTPKTGDTNAAPFVAVMLISAAVMVALVDYERRRKLQGEKNGK